MHRNEITRRAFLGRMSAAAAAALVARAAGAAEMPRATDGRPPSNFDEARVPKYVLPDPLVTAAGRPVADAEAWRKVRRPEILRLFEEHVYGRTPAIDVQPRFEVTRTEPRAVGGLATRKEITIRLFDDPAAPTIALLVYVPNNAAKPVPAFLGLNYYGNQCVDPDPSITASERWMRPASAEAGIVNNRATEKTRGCHASRWPLKLALERGYAVATYYYGDIEPDHREGWKTGLRGYLLTKAGRSDRAADEWGALAAWAWGLSRCLDYLETDPAIDAKRVAVFGHSRHGKTALWAGARDERFAVVISNDSGAAGAALARRALGEHVAVSVYVNPFWFCQNYARYANNEAAMPVDQHMLLALAAPRPVYVASATEDLWADPRGEFLACVGAEPVYRLFNLPGLGATEMPAPDRQIGGAIGYHVRTGKHDITAYDWEQYMNFADRHFGRGKSE